MPTKHRQKRADEVQPARAAKRARQRGRGTGPVDEAGARVRPPTMQASARRCRAMRSPEAAAKRKSKRAKRTHSLGGRLAAAIRLARLRAGRAAEEYFGAKR